MNLFTELKRRNVFRVGLAYGVIAWFIVQAADIMLDNFGAPVWVFKTVAGLLALGFPLALFLSWAYELTPEGVKKSADVAPAESATPKTGKRIDRLMLIALLGVIAVLVIERVWFADGQGELPAVANAPLSESGVEVIGGMSMAGAERSIAVLPFADLSPDGDQEYFSDGLAEEILNLLAAVRDLSVASRTSAFSFKGSALPVPEIAQRLDVHYILEGSVRKSGERIRVTAQLIDARTDRHLWSENYDRTFDDIFAIQDEIAGAIGEALQVELFGARGEAVSATEIVPELYEKFLQSRFLLRQRNVPAIARATTLLEEVVDGEPDFAPGLAQLAEAHLLAGGTVETAEQLQSHFDRILELVERALAIDPQLAGAYAVRANVSMSRGRYVDALRDYRRAIELDPGDPRPHHWLALLYADSGYLEQADRAIATSLRLDPDNANAQGWLADLLASRGEWKQAIEVSERVVALGNPVGHASVAMYLLALDSAGNLERAEAEMRLALDNGTPPNLVALDILEIAKGNEAALSDLLDRVRANQLQLYMGTTALLVLERREALLTLIERHDFLYHRLVLLVWSAEHVAMRRDPRFVEYLEHQGVTDLWRELGPPADCVVEGDGFRCGLIGERAR